jgi:phospholipase C
MKCFAPDALPVLHALAREFVVCDHWFSSMPGPTEPNRYFMHVGTAGAFDDSPTEKEILEAIFTPGGGFQFKTRDMFKKLEAAGVKCKIYAGDPFPVVAELPKISPKIGPFGDIQDLDEFVEDLRDKSFDAGFIHIEPKYDVPGDFAGGNSQHPKGGAAAGERLIKFVYETIRNSPVWAKSLLIITWDEHGGFYDHVAPPTAQKTGERGRLHGFVFDQLGPRVPAVIVSPLIGKNLIEHKTFDHTAIGATLRRIFKLGPFDERDGISGGVDHLVTLPAPRADAPVKLPDAKTSPSQLVARPRLDLPLTDRQPGLVAATIHSAAVQHLQITPPEQHAAIRARVSQLKTRGDAAAYLNEVESLLRDKRRKAAVR